MGDYVLGISAHFHDSAACLLKDGQLVAAAQEERFTRIKHDPALPVQAIKFCMRQAKCTINDISKIAYYEDPYLKLSRQIWMKLPNPFAVTPQTVFKLNPNYPFEDIRQKLGYEGEIKFYSHHQSHAASSFYCSGFGESAFFTIDGVGEWATMSWGIANKNQLKIVEENHFPHSIGLLYSTITSFLGFEVNDGEYKVMGLAPYGKPIYLEKLRKLVKRSDNFNFELDLSYFSFIKNKKMYSAKMIFLLEQEPRKGESLLSDFSKDVAASLQVLLNDLILEKVAYIKSKYKGENICLGGGVALNCVANSALRKKKLFKNIFTQPASSDAGNCLGAAYLAYYEDQKKPFVANRINDVYWGPEFSSVDVLNHLQSKDVKYTQLEKEDELLDVVSEFLKNGKVIGWFHGKMEFGPRSLGARSILADPRNAEMRDKINSLVKKREAFRPFAPAVLQDKMEQHFNIHESSPFMIDVFEVTSKLDLPAITHVDRTARVQTVALENNNKRFYDLLKKFDEKTNCPILLNTSFNFRGEPIVCTPQEALLCFVRSDIDVLVLENFIIERSGIPAAWLKWIKETNPIIREGVSNAVYTFI